MVWRFWASSSEERPAQPKTELSVHPSTIAQPAPEPVKAQLSRDEQASLEFEEFMKEIQVEHTKETEAKEAELKASGKSRAQPTAIDITPDALYPTSIRCQSAFDYAMFCQGFGGQFVNIYRYGEFRSCSNHWKDFWLCMRTRNWDEKEKAKTIQDHYKTRAIKWKMGPSSEDIWEVRTEPVKDAFQESLEDLERKIEDWKQSNPGKIDPWSRESYEAGLEKP